MGIKLANSRIREPNDPTQSLVELEEQIMELDHIRERLLKKKARRYGRRKKTAALVDALGEKLSLSFHSRQKDIRLLRLMSTTLIKGPKLVVERSKSDISFLRTLSANKKLRKLFGLRCHELVFHSF